jgi:ketosteroid isomerase-like protein
MSETATRSPREVFNQQIEYLLNGDREAQLRLYADDLNCEFPFAADRPRKITGVAEFRRVMEPLWQLANSRGVKIVGYRGEIHEVADDPELIFAEFTLSIKAGERLVENEFVQRMRVRNGKIASLSA